MEGYEEAISGLSLEKTTVEHSATDLTEDEKALKRAILGKFRAQPANQRSQLDELLEELLRLNIK